MDNDNQDKSGLQKATDTYLKAKKGIKIGKKVIAIIGFIISNIGTILIVSLVAILIMLPIIFMDEIKEKGLIAIDKFVNLVSLNGWNESEQAFFNTLQKEYQSYENYKNKEGEFDAALLASTIHYKVIISPDAYSVSEDDKRQVYNYDPSNPVIGKEQIRSFYKVANDKLGSAHTLVPGQKRLIGHLVDTRFETQCVEFKLTKPTTWNELGEVTQDSLNDLINYLKNASKSSIKDVFNQVNIINIINLIYSYNEIGQNYFIKQMSELGYEMQEEDDLLRIMKQSDLSGCNNDNEFPIPVITKFINYDYYKEYLMEEFLEKELYATCEKCEYEDATEERKEELKEQWIEEIFDQRQTYNYLMGNTNEIELTKFIPGISSLPVQISDPKNWIRYMTRGYDDRQCFRNDLPTDDFSCHHQAIDLGLAQGTPVLSIANGKVLSSYFGGSGGNSIKIGHDIDNDGEYDYYSYYAHLHRRNVEVGQLIGGGQKIGEVGNTGNSTGNHLHFTIQNKDGEKIDPEPILNGIVSGNSVLNPFSNLMTCKTYNDSEIFTKANELRDAVITAKDTNNGYGTREGVVAAVNYLVYDFGARVPYWYGGEFNQDGFNSEWGCDKEITKAGSSLQSAGIKYPYGLDSFGFVKWALINGGYKVNSVNKAFNLDKVKRIEADFSKVKPGDLVWREDHVGIIIDVDYENDKYFVAEEKSPQKGLVVSTISSNSSIFSHVIFMERYYDDDTNKK